MNFESSYICQREDVISLIPAHVIRVLDVGCSIGTLGKQIKLRFGAIVVGIEINSEMSKAAEEILDKVYCIDIESEDTSRLIQDDRFDCIVFADVLEHTRDPWKILSDFSKILSPDGHIVASIPNVRHISTIKELLIKGNWPYRTRGIHDRHHLRFFTLKNIIELFEGAGLEIITIKRNFRTFEHRKRKVLDIVVAQIMSFFCNELMVFQYLICARAKNL